MKPKIRMVVMTGLTHGAALLSGAAIAVAVTEHAPSRAQAQPAAAEIAKRQDPPAARVAAPADTKINDAQSDGGYREWLEREAAMTRQ